VIDADNPQQGGKKGKDKNKDVVTLVDERLGDQRLHIDCNG